MDKEVEKQLEDAMDQNLKNNVKSVKEELKELSNGKEYGTFDTIEPELVDKLCKENDLNPTKQFKDAMNTPFAIAKYIDLQIQDNEMCKEVEKDLALFLDKEKANWILHHDLSNEITFTKPQEKDKILEKLIVKYRKDPLTDRIIYSLHGNWDISKQNLKGLVEGGEVIASSGPSDLKPTIKTLSDKEFVFEIGNKFIITCKQS